MKKFLSLTLALVMTATLLTGCGSNDSESSENESKKTSAGSNGELKVYNWGEYIDEEVIYMFEEETGIHVTYDMFETNEEMYPIIEAGGVA